MDSYEKLEGRIKGVIRSIDIMLGDNLNYVGEGGNPGYPTPYEAGAICACRNVQRMLKQALEGDITNAGKDNQATDIRS